MKCTRYDTDSMFKLKFCPQICTDLLRFLILNFQSLTEGSEAAGSKFKVQSCPQICTDFHGIFILFKL